MKETLLEQWQKGYVSPVGIVDKTGADGPDIHIIDDYSFPDGGSVNDFTDRANLPDVSYNPPRDIAKRIHVLKSTFPNARILLLLVDVAGAFRHLPIHADHVHMFASSPYHRLVMRVWLVWIPGFILPSRCAN